MKYYITFIISYDINFVCYREIVIVISSNDCYWYSRNVHLYFTEFTASRFTPCLIGVKKRKFQALNRCQATLLAKKGSVAAVMLRCRYSKYTEALLLITRLRPDTPSANSWTFLEIYAGGILRKCAFHPRLARDIIWPVNAIIYVYVFLWCCHILKKCFLRKNTNNVCC